MTLMEYSGKFCVCRIFSVLLGLFRFSVLSNVRTGEAMELCGIFLTFSVFQIILLVTLNLVWQIKSFF